MLSLSHPERIHQLRSTVTEHSAWWLPVLVIMTVGVNEVYRQLLLLFAIFGLYLIVRHPKDLLGNTVLKRLALLLGCFVVPMTLSLLDSYELGRSLEAYARFLSYFLVGVFLFKLTWRPGFERYIAYGILGVMLFWCLDGLLQYARGTDLFGHELYANSRLTGPFDSPKLGFVLAILSPIYFEAVRLLARRYSIAWLLLLPLVATVLLGGSRSSWVLMFFGGLIYFFYLVRSYKGGFPWRRLLLPLILISVLGGGMIAKVDWLQNRVTAVVDLFSGDYDQVNNATSIRLPLWSSALQITEEHWINGVGLRSYASAYYDMAGDEVHPMFKGVNGHPHLFLLEVSSELGVFGVIGYGVFLIILLRACLTQVSPVATPMAIAALLAAFPLSSTLALYSPFVSSIVWTLVITWILIDMRLREEGGTQAVETPLTPTGAG